MKTPATAMQAPLVLPPSDRSSVRRWILAAIVVVLVHAGLVWWLSRRVEAPNPAGAPDAAIMIELPPMAVSQPAPAADVPEGPQMREAAPEPEAAPPPPPPEAVEPPQAPVVPELPPEPKPDAVLVAPAKPAPETPPKQQRIEKEKIERQKLEKEKLEKERLEKAKAEKEKRKAEEKEVGPAAPRTSAPRHSAGAPGRNAGEARPGAGGSAVSPLAWEALVSARVNANTRYPSSAQGATGAATVTFSIDRSGRLASAGLSRSSGSAALDAEAVATVRRSSPFPPPPAGVPGGRFNFSKTINFRH